MATTEETPGQGVTATETGTARWGPTTLVRVLLGFWAAWWSLVFATNFFDGFIQLGVLGEGWTLASGNFGFLTGVMGVHGTPGFVVALVFAGGVVWELIVAVLTWQAFADALNGGPSIQSIYRAFVPAVAFFGAFLLLTELFLAYELAGTHVRLFVAVLVSLFAIDRLL